MSPVRLLVIDDDPLAAVIRREWAARGTGDLIVRKSTAAEILAADRLSADAVIYPSGLLGELVERRLIVPVPDRVLESPTLAWSDVFRLLRLKEATWGEQTYGLPLGSPQLVVYYRKDLFERLGLSPPRTWQQYQALLPRLAAHSGELPVTDGTRTESQPDVAGRVEGTGETHESDAAAGEPAPPFATVEPLGPGWAAQTLLARSASYARHRSQYSTLFDFTSMRPLIDGPPFVRALEELVAAAEYGPPEPWAMTPADTRRLFANSQAAMALSWPTRADGDPSTVTAAVELPEAAAGFVELPGSVEVYQFLDKRWDTHRGGQPQQVPLLAMAGRLGSVARETPHSQAAFAVLVWLTGQEWSGRISPASGSTTLFRSTQTAAPLAWMPTGTSETNARDYAELVQRTQTSATWLTSLRLPGRSDYLTALDRGVQRAIRKEADPATALREVAATWDEITDRMGRDRQRDAYQRSIGVAP